MKDYYKILDITADADLLKIKKAYRKLALQFHPDKNKDANATMRFIEITEAYEVLKDEKKRAYYDQLMKIRQKNSESRFSQETKYQNQEYSWTEFGRQKAGEYSSMKYDDFAKKVLEEVKIGASYTPNIILIIFILIGVIGMIKVLNKMNGSMMPIALFIIFSYSVVVYFLFKRMQSDYREERRRKFGTE